MGAHSRVLVCPGPCPYYPRANGRGPSGSGRTDPVGVHAGSDNHWCHPEALCPSGGCGDFQPGPPTDTQSLLPERVSLEPGTREGATSETGRRGGPRPTPKTPGVLVWVGDGRPQGVVGGYSGKGRGGGPAGVAPETTRRGVSHPRGCPRRTRLDTTAVRGVREMTTVGGRQV